MACPIHADTLLRDIWPVQSMQWWRTNRIHHDHWAALTLFISTSTLGQAARCYGYQARNSHSDVLYKTPPEFFVVNLWIAFHSSTSVWNYLYLLTERSGHTPKHRNHARRMRPHEAYSSSSQQIAGCGQSSSPHSPLHNLLEHLGRHEIPPKHTLCLRADSWFQLCHYHNTFSATASEFPWVQLSHENLCSHTNFKPYHKPWCFLWMKAPTKTRYAADKPC